jgi:hypothetical protein
VGFFNKTLLRDYEFLGGDSLSPKAVQQGIIEAETEFGEYPLWLPWMFSGLPSVHSFQNVSDLYIPHIVFKFFMSIGLKRFWEFIFHYVFAAMGMILLMRYLKIRELIALFGGVSYMLMPYLITMIVHGHGSQMMTTAFIPWIMWAILKLKDTPSWQNMGLVALLMGLQLQRAHVQIAYYTWMLVGLYLFVELLRHFSMNQEGTPKGSIMAILSLLLAVTMSLWIYLPVASYTPFSIRGTGSGGGTGLEYATQWSFSLGEMLTFINPSYYGFGGATYWGTMPFTDYPNYMGILILGFALYGLLKIKDRFRAFLVIASVITLLLSFGHHFNIFYQFFYSVFPYFDKFRVPVMILVLLQFTTVVLAGLGLEDIFKKIDSDNTLSKKIFFIFGALFTILILLKLSFSSIADFGDRSHPILNTMRIQLMNDDTLRISAVIMLGILSIWSVIQKWLSVELGIGALIFLSIFDLGWVDQMVIEPSKESYRQNTLKKREFLNAYLKEDSIIRFLKNDTTKFRILPLGPLAQQNRWSAFQIESVTGYHPAKLANYNATMIQIGWDSPGFLQMLNVKYLISLEILNHPDFQLVHSGSLFNNDKYQQAYIYEFRNHFPRLFYVESLIKISLETEQITYLKNQEFNPKKNTFLSDDIPEFIYDPSAQVELISWAPNSIKFKTKTSSPQLLAISEIYYPSGWHLNNNVEIIELNGLIRGIQVAAGEQEWEMIFAPDDLKYGTIISIFSMLLVFGLLFIPYIRKK